MNTLHPWPQSLVAQNLTVRDAFGSLLAAVAFAAVLYAPGYLLGYAADLFGFRRLSLPHRSAWAISLSFLLSPIAAYLTGRVLALRTVSAVFALAGLGTLLLLWRRPPGRIPRGLTILLGGWAVFVLLMLVDFQLGHRLYFSVVMADQSYRIAFTEAVVRTGVPPANPLYFAGHLAPMRYYYFWYVLCAAVVRMAPVSAAQAFNASSIWAGFGLLAVAGLFGKDLMGWNRRQRWIGVALLGISGLDLLPAVGQALLQPTLNGDTEWWSVDPIDSWPDSLLWVPHHVAAVLCCLIVFLLLWQAARGAVLGRVAVLLAALGFASAVGLSVYVAFGFVLLVMLWLFWVALRRQPGAMRLWRLALAAGLGSLLPLLPFLWELTTETRAEASVLSQAGAPAGPPAHLFALSVRRMIDSELLTGLPVFAGWHARHPVLLDQGLRLVLLVPGLAMELGLYGVVLLWLLAALRRGTWRPDPLRAAALCFALGGLAVTLFLSSSVISNNDFGYRAVMLPQFFLWLLTADLLGAWWQRTGQPAVPPTPARRRTAWALLGIGAAGMVYWAVLLRAWLPIEVRLPRSGYAASPAEAFQIREAFAALDRVAPPGAVVAFRPIDPTPDRQGAVMVPNEYYQRSLVRDAGRQMLNAEGKCAVHFGGDPRPCPEIQAAVARLYGIPVPGAGFAEQFCAHFGVRYLVNSVRDPDWNGREAAVGRGWPQELPVVAAEPRLRIVQCAALAPAHP